MEHEKGNSEVCGVTILADKMGTYDVEIEMKSDLEDLAQLPVTVYHRQYRKNYDRIRGTKGEWIKDERNLASSSAEPLPEAVLRRKWSGAWKDPPEVKRRHGSTEQTRE